MLIRSIQVELSVSSSYYLVHISLKSSRGRFALSCDKPAKLFLFNATNFLSPAREFGQCLALRVNVGPVGRSLPGKAETRGTAALLMRSGRDEWDCLSSRTDNRTSIILSGSIPLLIDPQLQAPARQTTRCFSIVSIIYNHYTK
jgi:hypothetical protein